MTMSLADLEDLRARILNKETVTRDEIRSAIQTLQPKRGQIAAGTARNTAARATASPTKRTPNTPPVDLSRFLTTPTDKGDT